MNEFTHFLSRVLNNLDVLFSSTKRTYFVYLISAFLLATCAYLFSKNRQMISSGGSEIKSTQGLFKYLFPKDVYLHHSAKQDYCYCICNSILYYSIIAIFLLNIPTFILIAEQIFSTLFRPMNTILLPPTTLQLITLTIVYVLALDFGVFITHYLQHKIPILWAFHKVHHSAERLTPITLYRMHPVDLIFTSLTVTLVVGLSLGSLMWLWNIKLIFLQYLGLNFIIFLYYIFGYNLRHSHIWLNYPKWLSHILVSPAQHQTHHSIEKKHWNKNMGLIFAFWDWGFNTLYIPEKYEKKFNVGLSKDEPNPYHNVYAMYTKPFKEAWLLFSKGRSPSQSIINLTLIVILAGYAYHIFWIKNNKTMNNKQKLVSIFNLYQHPNITINQPSINTAKTKPPLKPKNPYMLATVQIEDLTWSEVKHALNDGFDRVIIPTGGIEQNGRHMILGKHNYIVKYGSENIAKKIGKTLVAPVISYVPEEYHMSYPGTISVSKKTFAAILEDSAKSLKRHGFKYIFFIGDSYHNQNPQQKVANKLNKQWHTQGVVVANITDYYSNNKQIEWLKNQGHSPKEIGKHAGIRDTSELLFIHKPGVRDKTIITPTDYSGGDTSGLYKKASHTYGKKMIELKIEAAISQINKILGKHSNPKDLYSYEVNQHLWNKHSQFL